MRTLSKVFVERYCKPRNKSWKEVQRRFNVEINGKDDSLWGNRRVQDITKRDVVELLDRIVDRG